MRVAFTMIGKGSWTGGEIYLRNLLETVATRLEGLITPVLFLTPQEMEQFGDSLRPWLSQPPVVSVDARAFGRASGLADALATGIDRRALRAFLDQGCTTAFESAVFYGWRFPMNVVAWMPDFQHRYMPRMFSRWGRLRREIGFRAQTGSRRTVMLSSQTARQDVERFYPRAHGKTAVVQFAQRIDIAGSIAMLADLKARYQLPDRFIFCPGQFWKHKNHVLIADALGEARRDGVSETLPLIVMSGRQDDVRNPGAYDAFRQRLASSSTSDRVRHLGLIPYADVLGLTAGADALLNPSLFEGWSTPVEEAKALGTPLAISDLAIHREQAPGAHFFDPADPRALLRVLRAVGKRSSPSPSDIGTLVAAQEGRLDAYANQLLAAFNAPAGTAKSGRR